MATLSETKTQNIISILKAMRQFGDVTKPMLQNACNLTASTVHGMITQLEKDGLVYCCGISGSNGGRKASLYRINKDYKYIIGVCLRIGCLKIGLLDFDLNILEQKNIALSLPESSVEDVVQKISKEILDFIQLKGLGTEKIAGVGVNVPGPVDFQNGIVLGITGASQWRKIALKERLEKEIKMPVTVEKDLNSGMQYVYFDKPLMDNHSTVCLSVCDGIAAGILIDGNIYRGKHSLAGELGHITMNRDGKVCRCGNVGCLELYSSDIGIVDLYNEENPKATPKVNIEQVIDAAERGDQSAIFIFKQATTFLAETISNIIMMYDPNEILINCSWLYLQRSLFFNLLDKQIERSTFSDRSTVSINILETTNFYLLGAAAMVAAQELFDANSVLYKNEACLFE